MTWRVLVTLPAALLAQQPPRLAGAKPLRITAVKTIEVRGVVTGKGLVLPWDPKKIPQDTRDYVITQLFTREGLVGTSVDGEYQLPKGIGADIQSRAEAYFIGKDPFDIDRHNADFFQKQPRAPRTFYLEIALWDIIGKACGQPLHRMWGSQTTRVRPYAATVHVNKTAEERAQDALAYYEKGFRAIKLRLHSEDPEHDLALARTVINDGRHGRCESGRQEGGRSAADLGCRAHCPHGASA